MKTVINKSTGEVLYSFTDEVHLCDNEVVILEVPKIKYTRPFFDFETKTFYEGATSLELNKRDNELRTEYSEQISNIVGMKEAIERFMFDGVLPTQALFDERKRLKTEYKEKKQL